MMSEWITDENQVEQIRGMTVEFPYCLIRQDLTEFVVPWHWHEELELGYIETGTSIIRTLDQEYPVYQGDGFFINTNVLDTKHNGMPGRPCLEINHLFHPVFLGGHFRSRITTKYLDPVLHNQQLTVHVIHHGTPKADAILRNLVLLKDLNGRENQEIPIRNLLSETWLLLLQELPERTSAHPLSGAEKKAQIQNMLSYIHRHYGEKLSLEEIAGAAAVSPREANRIFRSMTGQTPFEYLIQYRLERARQLLKDTDLPITEIALMCGFTDGTYLGKLFRRAFDETPRDYRNSHKR